MTDPTSRMELLRAARAVQRSAVSEDLNALHDEMCRLRNALLAPEPGGSDGAATDVQRRLIRHGRRRLVRFIDEVLATTRGSAEECTCLVRGAELRSLVVRQIRLEAAPRARSRG